MSRSRLVLLLLLWPALAQAARPVEQLTHCETTVTGQGEAERARGLGLCLAEVLVRVSGDPALAGDPRVEAMKPAAAAMVSAIEYEDRMKALPVGDEQGTRDRPFFLRATFKPDAIEADLKTLGRTPWGQTRPVVAAVIVAHREADAWIVSRGIPGVMKGAQVEALDAAGARFGVPLALPAHDKLAALGLLPGAPVPPDIAARLGADALLIGDLTWDEPRLGWRAVWQFGTGPGRREWALEGVSFDDAFRAGVSGAAQILSGSGQP